MPHSLLALLLAACGSDIGVTQNARCDGILQPGEVTVDDAFDADDDGFFDASNKDCAAAYDADRLDCADGDPEVNPAAMEIGCNGVDDDCDEATSDDGDLDGDGIAACDDCDDNNAAVHPGATELACNDLDDDCNAATPDSSDADQDGYDSCTDCDDASPSVNPGGTEVICNGFDDDCDAVTLDEPDEDGDGYPVCDDCDDTTADLSPGNEEICDNEIDDNCSGEVDEECTIDLTGNWVLDQPVKYQCASILGIYYLVDLNFQLISITDANPTIIVVPSPTASQPGTMGGSYSSDEEFEVSSTLVGDCTEDYILDAYVADEATLNVTFRATFTGVGKSCSDCKDQSWTLTATR